MITEHTVVTDSIAQMMFLLGSVFIERGRLPFVLFIKNECFTTINVVSNALLLSKAQQ